MGTQVCGVRQETGTTRKIGLYLLHLTAALPGAVAVVYMECPEWGMWIASISLGVGGKLQPRGCGGNGGGGLGSSGGSEAAGPVCRARAAGRRYLMGPAGGAVSWGRQGALPHEPGGRRPRPLRQLPLQLLEALLGGPLGPELPQAAREVLVQ